MFETTPAVTWNIETNQPYIYIMRLFVPNTFIWLRKPKETESCTNVIWTLKRFSSSLLVLKSRCLNSAVDLRSDTKCQTEAHFLPKSRLQASQLVIN